MAFSLSSIRKWLRIIWISAGAGFTVFLWFGFQASSDVPARLTGTRIFPPQQKLQHVTHGLLFLPGGMVDPDAYTPLLDALAARGFASELIELPWRCACTESQTEELFARIRGRLRQKHPGVDQWVLAGHSRGAMLASRFAHAEPSEGKLLAGLVLIGTTHPRDFSLAHLRIPVVKIYGTDDRIAPEADMRRNQNLLPPHTEWVSIYGGNHSQFGYYRYQLGDHRAAIPRKVQQDALEKALAAALSSRQDPSVR